MTNVEAIETLRANYPDACYEQLREAVDAAIEVLKAQGAAVDTISRQATIDTVLSIIPNDGYWDEQDEEAVKRLLRQTVLTIENESTQSERDIPKKPNEVMDKAWGIPHRQAVCPNCDSYLGIIHFISKDGMPMVTYCESCGQAIDWEGWDKDE